MAVITKTPSNTWKAIIRKRDVEDLAHSTQDEMVRGVYINLAGAYLLLIHPRGEAKRVMTNR